MNGMLAAIAREAGPSDSLAVLPEGVMLNYLLRRPNPTRHVSVMPPELAIFGEREILASYEAHPPDLVALLPRDLKVYGLRGFGVDFAQSLGAWLQANYEQVAVVPGSGWELPATLLRHKPAAAASR